MNRQYVVVIPAFNEARTIRAIAEACLRYCPLVVIVDDGSSDGTVAELEGLDIILLKNEQNMGKAASLWRGMEEAMARGGTDIITLDGDGQHKPEDLPRIMAAAERHPDSIIIGSRLANKADFPAKRYYANKVANFWISWAAGWSIEDSQSGYRLYPAELLKKINLSKRRVDGFVFEREILIVAASLGHYCYPVPIAALYHEDARPSHFRGVTDIVHITRMVAWKLISGLGRPLHFYRAFIRPRFSRQRLQSICGDGWSMLLLSALVFLASLGLSAVLAFLRVLQEAREGACTGNGEACVLVMGMKLHDGQLLADFRKRLDRARVLGEDARTKIVVLGGKTSSAAESEGEAGCRYLREHGLPAEQLIAEGQSRHTLENLQQARELLNELGCQVPALITNRYHLARCRAMAEGLGMEVRMCAAEAELKLDPTTLYKVFKETFFLHWYLTGMFWGRLTGNRRIQNKIT